MSFNLKLFIRRPVLVPFAVYSFLLDKFIRPDRNLKGSGLPPEEPLGEWHPARPLPSWRYEFAAGAVGDEIYLIGGLTLPTVYTITRRVEAYNSRTDTWRTVSPFPVIIHHPAVAVVDDYLYVVGGNGFRINAYRHTFQYDPKKDRWLRRKDMPTPRGALGIAALDGLIYAVGGASPIGWKAKHAYSELEVYNPRTDEWRSLAPMPTAREHLAGASAGGLFFALGGYQKDMHHCLNQNEAYDPAADKWERRAPLPRAFCGISAVAIKDRIFVFGGECGWAISGECYEYRVFEDKWHRRRDMDQPLYAPAVAAVNGRIHVMGGNSYMHGYKFSLKHGVFVPGGK